MIVLESKLPESQQRADIPLNSRDNIQGENVPFLSLQRVEFMDFPALFRIGYRHLTLYQYIRENFI